MMPVTNGMMPMIKATRREFVAVLDSFVFCDLCESEETAFTNMYYIPVLNQVYCERCKNLYCESAVRYKVDDKMMNKNLNRLKEKFVDLGVWEYSGIV